MLTVVLAAVLTGLAAATMAQRLDPGRRLTDLSPSMPGAAGPLDDRRGLGAALPGPGAGSTATGGTTRDVHSGARIRPWHGRLVVSSRPAFVLAAVACWLVVGGAVGVGLAACIVVWGPRCLARLPSRSAEQRKVALSRDLPLALDLLAACLAGGASLGAAVSAVAAAVPGECGDRLQQVAAALSLGSAPQEAWAALAGGDREERHDGAAMSSGWRAGGGSRDAADDVAGPAARTLARAAETGAPIAAAVARVAVDARLQSRAVRSQAARQAGVLAVAPLGLCFLPAFVLLGVVPVVLGLAGPLLTSL